jgi:hypothetical protein
MPRPHSFDHDLARSLRADGWSLRAIAARCRISHVAVWQAVKDISPFGRRKRVP